MAAGRDGSETLPSPWLAVVVGVAWMAGAAISPVAGVWLALGGTAVVLGTVTLVRQGPLFRDLLRPAPGPILGGLLVGVLMTLLTYLLFPPLVRLAPPVGRDVARLYHDLGASFHLWPALALVPVIIGEELVWRGLVQGTLARRFRPGPATLVAALLYAIAQVLTGSPALVLTALACGIVWGGLRATTGGLVAPIVAHILWDEIVLFAAPLVGS